MITLFDNHLQQLQPFLTWSTLQSPVTKIFERVIKEFIQHHLECNRLLGDFQHGFRQHKSCLTQLLIYQEEILKNLECGYACDSVYLDFAKAFDKVDLGILGHRIRAMGIYGEIGIWLHDFLLNRTQQVLANGELSKKSIIRSGVPQGTVLGPLCFLIMINSIDDDKISAFLSSFADDTKVNIGIKSIDDATKLQESLELLYKWQDESNMAFSAT